MRWHTRHIQGDSEQPSSLCGRKTCECREKDTDLVSISLGRVRGWPGSGTQRTKGSCLYYSGGKVNEHKYGVAILISSYIEGSVLDFIPYNDRAIMIRIRTFHRIMNIIQVYAPINDKRDEDVEMFYNNMEELLKLTKKGEITFVMKDFNSKIGMGIEGDTVGKYGLRQRNVRGDRLVQSCIENDLLVANIYFKLHARRLYTWKLPADAKERIVKNQIDFILMKQELKKSIKSVKNYPGADINSDHNLVVMKLKIRQFKNIKKNENPKPQNKLTSKN
ncbi:hypothetical protein ACFW04_014454 [Cataglyphis niger]